MPQIADGMPGGVPRKVFLDSVGCRLNQAEIERYARQFHQAGLEVVHSPAEADIVVLNTCSVTAAAASDSRQKARQAARQGVRQIVLTGCWSTLQPDAAAALPSVVQVVPNNRKDELVMQILPEYGAQAEPLQLSASLPLRLRTRAFIKVQDGCNNRCAFCVTTLARGPSRSRSLADVLADIRLELAEGAQEIVLSGVHLGAWGQDLTPKKRLADLLQGILLAAPPARLRLSSLEPWDISESLLALWQDHRLCRHLHLPLQSGCAATLRRMARKTTPEAFARLVALARRLIPDVAITTDIIVGFPGESEAEFAESLAFVEGLALAGGHVFSYSERPGAPAARMPYPVPHPLRKARSAQMQAVLERSAEAYRRRFLGAEVEVLWEGAATQTPQGWQMSGLSDNYLRVTALAERHLWNQLSRVRLENLEVGGLSGKIVVA